MVIIRGGLNWFGIVSHSGLVISSIEPSGSGTTELAEEDERM
jgi:hypothetical protein